jgi:tetratricopeptide (TPR) repeat protein
VRSRSATPTRRASEGLASPGLGSRVGIVHNNLGLALERKGELDQAIAEYEKALQLESTAVFYQNLGNALFRKQRTRDAAAAYRKALALEPKNPAVRAAIHNAEGFLLRVGKPAEAAAAFREATRLNKGNATYWKNLGRAYQLNGEYARAVEAHRAAIALDKANPALHAMLAADLRFQGSWEEAIRECEEAIRLKPDYAPAYGELGLAVQQAGRLDEAVAALRVASLLQPADPVAPVNLGGVLEQMGRHDEAIAAFRQAVARSDGGSEGVFAHLARALRLAGHFAEAKEAAEKGRDVLRGHGGNTAPFDQEVKLCERLVALEAKKESVLAGKARPATGAEEFDCGLFCYYSGHAGAAVPYFARAFAAEPTLADQRGSQFVAALAAVRAAAAADGEEAARIRRQARDWLRAEWGGLKKMRSTLKPSDRDGLRFEVSRWLHHAGLAGVRDRPALANLSAAERREWQDFWAEVEALGKEGPDKQALVPE